MPKLLPDDLLDRVTNALDATSQGLSLAELQGALKDVVSRRSLQRRLNVLVRSGAIKAEGNRRGRRYFPHSNSPVLAADVEAGYPGGASEPAALTPIVLISAAGRQVQALVHRPIADRAPIGYQRHFLEGYLPNETGYFPENLKTHLRALGRTPDGHRPAGTYAREILNRLLVDLSWASSRLEGNTYSLLDTRELIEHGKAAQGKDAKETQMILNHKAAIELLVESAEEIGVNRYTITNLHALLADNLLEDFRTAGRLRTTPIAIGGTTYLPTAIPDVAIPAVSTRGITDDNVISGAQFADGFADGLNDARPFVTQDNGLWNGKELVTHRHVSMADTNGCHSDQDLVVPRRLEVELFQL